MQVKAASNAEARRAIVEFSNIRNVSLACFADAYLEVHIYGSFDIP
jgi:hypothetical protein